MSGECERCGHHWLECCCCDVRPEYTGLPQGPGSFFAAMECVYKGGKAWRPNWGVPGYGPWHPKNSFVYKNYEGGLCEGLPDREPWRDYVWSAHTDDLEATDWVCEPKEGG